MTDILVKTICVQDVGDIVDMFDRYLQFYEKSRSRDELVFFLRERILNCESIMMAAYVEDVACGFVQIYNSFSSLGLDRIWVLNDLFVERDYRGRGIASALMDHVHRAAERNNLLYVQLETNKNNQKAIALYKRFGYASSDEFEVYSRRIRS